MPSNIEPKSQKYVHLTQIYYLLGNEVLQGIRSILVLDTGYNLLRQGEWLPW
ncbi:hypothetical protein OUHCRE11_40120 [Enterobacter asburiae]|nr:hypothetical protein ENTKAS01_17260 [Enterobacter sp. AS-1]